MLLALNFSIGGGRSLHHGNRKNLGIYAQDGTEVVQGGILKSKNKNPPKFPRKMSICHYFAIFNKSKPLLKGYI